MMLYWPGFLVLSFPPEDPDSEDPLMGTQQRVAVTTASCRLWVAATAPGETSETRSPLTTCRNMKRVVMKEASLFGNSNTTSEKNSNQNVFCSEVV